MHPEVQMNNCLIIIDIQNDFCPGGALAVAEGDMIIPAINALTPKFDKVVATQDWHPPGHISFAKTHNKKPYDVIYIDGMEQTLWPEHCMPGTSGACFHKDLDLTGVDLIIRKGNNPLIDSYSAFLENDKKTETGLRGYLSGLGLKNLYLCGLATDYCVYFSAMDAVIMGFSVTLLRDLSRGIDVPAGSVARALDAMKEKGVRIANSGSLACFN
jgi:nicotinamidase/pyrazinamidase